MDRLHKIYNKYSTSKNFHINEGFAAYSFKDNEMRKKIIPYTSNKSYYGNSCDYDVVIKTIFINNTEIEKQFNDLATKWENETGLYSTITPKVVNNSFYDLLLLGKDKSIITLILKRLQQGAPAQWHIILHAITKANPVPDEYISKSKKIKEYWILWGKDNNYII